MTRVWKIEFALIVTTVTITGIFCQMFCQYFLALDLVFLSYQFEIAPSIDD